MIYLLNTNYRELTTRFVLGPTDCKEVIYPRIKFMSNLWIIYDNSCYYDVYCTKLPSPLNSFLMYSNAPIFAFVSSKFKR